MYPQILKTYTETTDKGLHYLQKGFWYLIYIMIHNRLKCTKYETSAILNRFHILYISCEGAQWLNGRVLNSRLRGRGFEPNPHRCVVSLSKTHLS